MHRLGHASPAAALRYQRAERDRDAAALAAAISAALRQSEGPTSTDQLDHRFPAPQSNSRVGATLISARLFRAMCAAMPIRMSLSRQTA